MESYREPTKLSHVVKRVGELMLQVGVAFAGHCDPTAGAELTKELQIVSELSDLQGDQRIATIIDQWSETHGA